MTEVLAIENLSFRYRKGLGLILDGFSAHFDQGEMVAITGPSGRGKSTLLYLVGLLLTPVAGKIVVDGVDTSKLSDFEKSQMRAFTYGFIFQDAALDPTRTVLDNITETALYRNQPIQEAKERALLLVEQFGVDLRIDHRPGQISGGQAQRVAICRALLGDPKIVLADEPTGNLDYASGQVVIDALRTVAQGGGLVLTSTHDPVMIEACDRRIDL